MPVRPDWVVCIANVREPGLTLCGRKAMAFEFTFVDAGHALNNAMAEGRLVTCDDCADAVVGYMRRHRHHPLNPKARVTP
jgi:hypothetical protein